MFWCTSWLARAADPFFFFALFRLSVQTPYNRFVHCVVRHDNGFTPGEQEQRDCVY